MLNSTMARLITNRKLILIVIGVLLACVIAVQAWRSWSSQSELDVKTASLRQDFPGLPENHRLIQSSADSINTLLSEGTGVVVFAHKDCEWCQVLVPLTNEAAEEVNYDKVHFIDPIKEQSKDPLAYQKLLITVSPYFQSNEEGLVKVEVPDVTIIKDGKVLSRFEMTEDLEDGQSAEEFWTAERRKNVTEAISAGLQSIKDTPKEDAN